MRKFLRSVVVCAVCVMGLAPLSPLAAQFKIMVAPRFERRDGVPSEEVRRAAPISDLPGRRLGAFLTELERGAALRAQKLPVSGRSRGA